MSDTAHLRTRASGNSNPAIDDSPSPALLQALEGLPDGILLLDRDWRITYANLRARQISRIQPQHFNGPTHWDIYPDTLGTPVETIYRRVMSTQREDHIESFLYEPFQVWLNIRVLPTGDGIALYYRDVTETHLAEVARLESDERARLALTAAKGVGTWDWDIPADLVFADERFARAYGIAPERARTGAPIAEVTRNILPDDLDAVMSAINDAMRLGGDFASEYRILQSDGTILWVSAVGRCTLDVHGAPSRFAGVSTDITERKYREEALRDSEERYRVLTELSPQSQWMANAQGLVLYANRRFLEYLGQDFVPSTGHEYIQSFDPLDRDRVLEAWTHSVTTGEDYNVDARLIRAADGASRWWQLRALPVRDEHGVIQQWLGSATDIHEERVAADQLNAQYIEIDRRRRELETIYHGSPIGMALYEPTELRLIRINDRQAEIFRLPAAEAIGKTYEELAGGVTRAQTLIRRAAAGENVLNQDLEGTLARQPNEYRFWNVNYSPIFDADGHVQAIAAATVETTQQKRAELALIQSEKLAAVGRMASSIAHEINNPLESVTNLIYIARTYAGHPEVENLLDLADQELRRVSIIANQTLRFHKQASSPREISCVDLFATVLSLYEGRLRNSSISVEKRKRAERPIACFEGDIRQVLNNLVGNAIDAMPLGGRLILRSREATDWRSGRKGLTLTVADTGTGMAADTAQQIFNAFFTTKGINGTGLGLWVSAEIVERHHGRLLLRSSQRAPHRGTVFALFLPFETLLDTITTNLIQ
jgi:PAS domain S-box-containing protein